MKADLLASSLGIWSSMAEVDSKMSETDVNVDHIDTTLRMTATIPDSFEPVRGTVIFFNNTQELEVYWNSEQRPGRKGVITNVSLMDRHVQLVSVVDIPWHDVLLLCHKLGGHMCHLPLHTQSFFSAEAKFVDDGHVENVIFTQHKM